jgi:Peptidase M15
MPISKDELLMGRDKQYPDDYTQEISDNVDRFLAPANKIRDAYGKPMIVNSGWRPPSVNGSTPGAATHSLHMQGLAMDIADPNGDVMAWALANLPLLRDLGIYMEDFRWCPDWVHFGLGAPASGHRIFVPSAARALAPERWDGEYDHSFDS